MNLNDRSDPTLMLLIFLGALSAAVWSLLSDLRPDAILSAVGSLAPLVLGAFAAASALAIQRLVSTNRTLRSRRTLAVVPADDFDPKPDAVLRFAAELGATDRSVLGWIDRRASAVRVALTGDAEGRLVYLVSVPERSFRFLQGALGAYDGVELREPGEVLGKRTIVNDRATHRTELVLARSGLEPLARLSLDPDPLRPFATALEAISPEAGEELSVCIDLLPATGWRRMRLRKRLQRLARRRHGERRSLREVLDGPQRGRGRPGPDQLLERRLINEALDAKLRDSGSLSRCRRWSAAEPGIAPEPRRRCTASSAPSSPSRLRTGSALAACRFPARLPRLGSAAAQGQLRSPYGPPASSGRGAARSSPPARWPVS